MARPKLGASESKRLQMVITEDELQAIEEWQHANKISSKSEAIRRLCAIGLLVDGQMDQMVDMASDGVDYLSTHGSELSEVFRLVINRQTYGMTFDRDQLWDLFKLAREQADGAEDDLRGLHEYLITIYNAIAALVDSRTYESATRKAHSVIEKANAAVDRANRRKAKRDIEMEENRYIGIHVKSETPEEHLEYMALTERKKSLYLNKAIATLKSEEETDPQAFAKKYGVDTRKFWEKPEWLQRLEEIEAEQEREDREV